MEEKENKLVTDPEDNFCQLRVFRELGDAMFTYEGIKFTDLGNLCIEMPIDKGLSIRIKLENYYIKDQDGESLPAKKQLKKILSMVIEECKREIAVYLEYEDMKDMGYLRRVFPHTNLGGKIILYTGEKFIKVSQETYLKLYEPKLKTKKDFKEYREFTAALRDQPAVILPAEIQNYLKCFKPLEFPFLLEEKT